MGDPKSEMPESFYWRPEGESLELAANFVLDAMRGRKVGYIISREALAWRRLFHSSFYRTCFTVLALVHMSLVFFESPARLSYPEVEHLEFIRHRTWLGSHDNVSASAFELIIVLCYCFDVYTQIQFMGAPAYLRSWNVVEAVGIVFFMIDILTTWISVAPGVPAIFSFQFSRVLRPLFLVTKRRHIRFILVGISRSVAGTIPVLVLLLLLLTVFGYVAALSFVSGGGFFQDAYGDTLYARPTETPPGCSALNPITIEHDCNNYFFNIGQSLYHLYNLLVKTEWPVAIFPFYRDSGAAALGHSKFCYQCPGLFFVLFLMLGHFLLIRLVLAVVFAEFKAYCSHAYVHRQRRTRAAYAAAFRLISHGGYVSLPVWRSLAMRVRGSLELVPVDALFRAVGGESGFIGRSGFIAACTLLDVKAERLELEVPQTEEEREKIRSEQPIERVREAFVQLFTSWWYEYVLGAVVIFGAILTFIRAENFTNNHNVNEDVPKHKEIDDIGFSVEAEDACFAIAYTIFLLEMILKIFAFQWKRYWKDVFNRVDASVVMLVTLSYIIDAAASSPGNKSALSDSTAAKLARVAIVLRVMRAVRIFKLLRRSWQVIASMRATVPILGRVIVILLLTSYVAAIVGAELFSGVIGPTANTDDPIYENPPHEVYYDNGKKFYSGSEAVTESSYGVRGFWAINLDSFPRSMMTQFALLMTSAFSVVVEGTMARVGWWAFYYWVFLYIVVVLIVSNVLFALIIQAYTARFKLESERDTGQLEACQHLVFAAQLDLAAERQKSTSVWNSDLGVRLGEDSDSDSRQSEDGGEPSSSTSTSTSTSSPKPPATRGSRGSFAAALGASESDLVLADAEEEMQEKLRGAAVGAVLLPKVNAMDRVRAYHRRGTVMLDTALGRGVRPATGDLPPNAEVEPAIVLWRLKRPSQFKTLGESLFGESLSADFEGRSLRVMTEYSEEAEKEMLMAESLKKEADELENAIKLGTISGGLKQNQERLRHLRAESLRKEARFARLLASRREYARNRSLTSFVRSPFAAFLESTDPTVELEKLVAMSESVDGRLDSFDGDSADGGGDSRESDGMSGRGPGRRKRRGSGWSLAKSTVHMLRRLLNRRKAGEASPWVEDRNDDRFNADEAEALAKAAESAGGWDGFSEEQSLLLRRGVRRNVRRQFRHMVAVARRHVSSTAAPDEKTDGDSGMGGGGGSGSGGGAGAGDMGRILEDVEEDDDEEGKESVSESGSRKEEDEGDSIAPIPRQAAADMWYLTIAEAARSKGLKIAEARARENAPKVTGALGGVDAVLDDIGRFARRATATSQDDIPRPRKRSSSIGVPTSVSPWGRGRGGSGRGGGSGSGASSSELAPFPTRAERHRNTVDNGRASRVRTMRSSPSSQDTEQSVVSPLELAHSLPKE